MKAIWGCKCRFLTVFHCDLYLPVSSWQTKVRKPLCPCQVFQYIIALWKSIQVPSSSHGSCYGTKGNGQWFQVGERVWYRNRARALRKIFLSPWCGPWEVVKVLSDVTYRIEEEIENLEVVIKGGWSTSTT